MFGEDGTSGSVLVEATIFVPMLVGMSIYVMDFGLLFYNKIEVQNAVQAGAQWAVVNRYWDPSEIQVAANNATYLPVTVSSNQFCGCLNNAVVTQIQTPTPSSLPSACTAVPNSTFTGAPNSACPSGSGIVGNYVKVSATTTYQSFFPYGLFSSTNTYTLTATVRVQ
jgi:hypothetical protein